MRSQSGLLHRAHRRGDQSGPVALGHVDDGFHRRGEFERAVRLLAKGLLHPQLLVTDRMPMRDVASAFAKIDRDDPSTIKVVLDLGGT